MGDPRVVCQGVGAAPRELFLAVRDDLFLVLRVPVLDPLRADVVDAVGEGHTLTHVAARGVAELAGATLGKLG